jgi:hypothetical protein
MVAMDYRTRDGLADYGFSIEPQSHDGWRVYIIFRPFRCASNDPLQLPYQSVDNKGRCYVNWPSRLDSLGEAKTVAGLWAELVEPYRRAQEEKALYVELIEGYFHAQEQKMTSVPTQASLGDAAGPHREASEQRDCDPAINAAASPESSTDHEKSQRPGRVTDEVA